MNEYILFLNLTKSFIHLNLFSYDKLGYIDLTGSFTKRLPQSFSADESSDIKKEIESLIDNEFLLKYKTDLSKVNKKYILTSRGSSTSLKKEFQDNYEKIVFSSAIKHENVLALLRSQKLSGLTILVYDDSGAKLLAFKLGKNEKLEIRVEKIFDDYIHVFGQKDIQEELKTVWAKVQKYNDDFDLFLNSANTHSYGVTRQKDLALTKFIFDNHIYKHISALDLVDIGVSHPLILTGSRYARDSDSNFILYSIFASLDKQGIYDVYLDKCLSIFNLLSINLEKGALPSETYLQERTEKYLNIKLTDEKNKYKGKEPVASLNYEEKEIYPYKGSMWGISTDSIPNFELSIKLMKGIKLGSLKDRQINLKNLKDYRGVIINTLDNIPTEYEELSEWQDKILEHFELK